MLGEGQVKHGVETPLHCHFPRRCPIARSLSLFDDQDLLLRQGLQLVPGPVTKLGLTDWPQGQAGEYRRAAFCGAVVPWEGGWRLYHSRVTRPGTMPYRLALAESADGLTWTPVDTGDGDVLHPAGLPDDVSLVQPQVVKLPGGGVRMYFWYHGHDRGRCPYLAADSADGVHFRIVNLEDPCLVHPLDLNVGQARWAAGLTAAVPLDEYPEKPTLDWWEAKRRRTNDAVFTYYNETSGLFELYSVWLVPNDPETRRYIPHDNAPQILRVMQRRESADGLRWSDPELIIIPDEHDPLDIQFYHMAVEQVGDWRCGLLGHYRCEAQTMDLELCFSRDGRHWQRPLRGAFIPRGGIDEVDYYYAYPTSAWLDRGDHWILLYDGGNYQHNGKLPPGVSEYEDGILAARLPKGRIAGLQTAGSATGSLELKVIPGEPQITVNADVRGALRAELRDIFGRPLEGYTMDECVPLTGDSPAHVLRWQGDRTSEPYRYDAVRLRLEITEGTIYEITV